MDKEINKKLKRKETFAHVMYWTNRILLPPAKIFFVLWTALWSVGSSSYIADLWLILPGYLFGCGIADLIYMSNQKRYLSYKMKITQRKINRLKKIMYKADPVKYQAQYGNREETTPKSSFLYRLFHKEPHIIQQVQTKLDRANQLAGIINSTYNFEEFVNSYAELISNMEFLQSVENLSFFTGRKPSEDLAEIKEKRPLKEKEFIDRYAYQHGKESLESNRIYFDRLLPETVQYIETFSRKPIQEQTTFNNFDSMEGHQFEYFCAGVLEKNGFSDVDVTQGSGDHGIDILAEKDGITYAIQCKCYSSNIGNSAVQQAHTGKSIYRKDIAVVLTNRYFTPQAKEEAEALGVKLWDRDKLNSMIEKI